FISKCTFNTGDDCIAFKPTTKAEGDHLSCEDIVVANCTFLHGHGLSIGGQTDGGMRRLNVHDCTFENTDAGIRMKAPRGRGGIVEDLSYENIKMKNVKTAIEITSYYPKKPTRPELDQMPAEKMTDQTPVWRNIKITNVTAEGSQYAGKIYGLPECPAENI